MNFPPRQIGKFMSEVLTLGFPDQDGEVVLIGPERRVPDGAGCSDGAWPDEWEQRMRCPGMAIGTLERDRFTWKHFRFHVSARSAAPPRHVNRTLNS